MALLLYEVLILASRLVDAAALRIIAVTVVPYLLLLELLKCAPKPLMSLSTATVEPSLLHRCCFSHLLANMSEENTTDVSLVPFWLPCRVDRHG